MLDIGKGKSMVKLTERAIMQAFLDLLSTKSMDKITVKDIIEKVGINRNTFYYHYEDIYDLIDAIFQQEVENVVSEIRDDSSFYDIYVRAAAILIEHKEAIMHLYDSKSREVIQKYLEKTTGFFIERFVRKAAEGYHLSEDGVKFITFYYSSATIAHTIAWIEKGMPDYRKGFIRMMSTSFEATVEDMIRNYIEETEE